MAGFTKCLIYALVSLSKETRIYLINVYSASLHGLSQRFWSLLWVPTMASSTEEQVDLLHLAPSEPFTNASFFRTERTHCHALLSRHSRWRSEIRYCHYHWGHARPARKGCKTGAYILDSVHKIDMTPRLRL